jgi:hypothetical protein
VSKILFRFAETGSIAPGSSSASASPSNVIAKASAAVPGKQWGFTILSKNIKF